MLLCYLCYGVFRQSSSINKYQATFLLLWKANMTVDLQEVHDFAILVAKKAAPMILRGSEAIHAGDQVYAKKTSRML